MEAVGTDAFFYTAIDFGTSVIGKALLPFRTGVTKFVEESHRATLQTNLQAHILQGIHRVL